MRIVQLLHGTPATAMGGTGLYVEALSKALSALGHTVAIAAPSGDHPGQAQRAAGRQDDIEVWHIGTPAPKRWRDTWDPPLSTWLQWLASWKPDVVHIHHLSGAPLGLVSAITAKTVLTLHDYAIPCARGQLVTASLKPCDGPGGIDCTQCLGPALYSNPLKAALGRILGHVPALYRTVRAQATRPTRAAHPAVVDRLEAAANALAMADVLLSPSQSLAGRIADMGHLRPSVSALPLLRPAQSQTPSPNPGPAAPVRFLFASSIIPTKGPDRVLRTFERLDEPASLSIAGHAPDFDGRPGFGSALKAKAASIDGVNWLGQVPPSEIPALMAAHDVLVLPSIWPENSPLVIREATASGMGIIATDTGGIRELAPHASFIDTDDDLLAAMKTAANSGRVRYPPRLWPSVDEHARELVATAYL